MTARKTATAVPAAVKEAKSRSIVPSRQVINHTSLFRAVLQQMQGETADALASADMALTAASSERSHELDAAQRAYDAACSVANSRFEAIRAEFDAERDDCIRKLDGIEAAFAAIDSVPAQVVQISQAAE